MSRPVNPDFEADREKMIQLFIEAKGDRNRKQFAEDSGLSLATISSIIHNRFEKPLTPTSLKKVAEATDKVSYEDLLQAAGYKPERYIPKEELEKNRKEKMDRLNHIIRSIIITYLADNSYSVDLTYSSNASVWDLTGDNPQRGKWYFDYLLSCDLYRYRSNERNIATRRILGNHLGRYVLDCNKGDRVSLVTDSEVLFNNIINLKKPLPIDLKLSVLLVDTESISVKKEVSLYS